MFKDKQVEKIAKGLYSKLLPYHNFQHATNIAKKALEITEICHKEGIEVNDKVVYYASIFHDAGYHKDHLAMGFKSKEEYSAHLAEEYLQNILDRETIFKIKKVIIATHKDSTFFTNEEKIVRAADLSGMAGDYENFEKNNLNLKAEFEMIHNTSVSLEEWKKKTLEIIEFYLSQDIRLTSSYADKNGVSIFHKKTKENLKRFLAEQII